MIYLDHAATTPLSEEAWAAMTPVLKDVYGNPSSIHRLGREARNHLTRSREHIAGLFNASARDLYFTSGATEANNWALRAAAALALSLRKTHFVTSAIEHPSVLAVCEALEAEGFEITYLKPDAHGIVTPDTVRQAIRPDTALVSIQWVNNEIGSMNDVLAIGQICREHDVLFHTDAVQAIAHQRIDWATFPAEFLTFSGHKFGGPKGSGALLTRSVRGSAIELASFIHGGRQERGRRAGTENLAGIVGMSAALGTSVADMAALNQRQSDLAERFLTSLESAGVDFRLHGPALASNAQRVPGIVNLYFPGVEGQTLLLLLDRAGVAVSLGSACEAGSTEASHVLRALGCSEEEASSSVRLSMGATTTEAEIDAASGILIESIERLLSR